MSPMGSCAKFLRKTFTSTITIGPPTTRRSSQRRHRDLATTIGGSLRFTRSTSQTVTHRHPQNLPFNPRFTLGGPLQVHPISPKLDQRPKLSWGGPFPLP